MPAPERASNDFPGGTRASLTNLINDDYVFLGHPRGREVLAQLGLGCKLRPSVTCETCHGETLVTPEKQTGREQVDKNEWQRSSYVRSAVAYDALSGAGTQRGGSQGWRTTCRFSCVPIGRAVAAVG